MKAQRIQRNCGKPSQPRRRPVAAPTEREPVYVPIRSHSHSTPARTCHHDVIGAPDNMARLFAFITRLDIRSFLYGDKWVIAYGDGTISRPMTKRKAMPLADIYDARIHHQRDSE